MLDKLSVKALLFILFFSSLVFHSLGTWSLPLMDRDEPRFAQASREMLETGDYLIPRFNGLERYDKPPLIYWCQSAAYRVFGDNDLAARFPSGLAAALTALIIFGFGSRLYGKTAGFLSAVLFTACLQTTVLAKSSSADALLTLFYSAALWSGWELLCHNKIGWWLLFYASLALGFLAKGPVIFLALFSVWIFAGLTKKRLGALSSLLGLGLAAGLVAVWAWPALIKTDGAFFHVGIGKHVLQRSVQPLEHHGADNFLLYLATLPFYLVTFFFSFLPWSFRAPKILRALKSELADPKILYLVCHTACVFIVFSLLSTKLPHYTFPAFPALSILWVYLWLKEKIPVRRFAIGAGFMVLVSLLAAFVVFPWASERLLSKKLVSLCAPYLTKEMRSASAGYNEPSLVWYLRKYIRAPHKIIGEQEAPAFMSEAGPRVCIVQDPGSVPGTWRTVSVRGFNIAKGRSTQLTAVIKPD